VGQIANAINAHVFNIPCNANLLSLRNVCSFVIA